MRLNLDQQLGKDYDRATMAAILKAIQTQVNAISEGRLYGAYNASTAAPTTGTYALGDFVRNSNPSEAGAGGSKYIIFGWECTASGTPGTWKDCRFLTGN